MNSPADRTEPPAEIRYCEHAARFISIEAPAITELLAALAHLDKAMAADPRDSAAFYAASNKQHLLPGWIRTNARSIRTSLDTLVARYTNPAEGHVTQVTTAPTSWTDPDTGRTWDLNADHHPAGEHHRHSGIVWRYRGLHAANGAPLLHPHQLPDRTPCAGPCWPIDGPTFHTP